MHGINVELEEEVTARDFLHRGRVVTQSERDRITGNLNRHQVDVYSGAAGFLDSGTIEVTGAEGATTRLTAGVFLIATGSIPYRPPNLPFDDPRVYDSDPILQMIELPKSLLVAGGGVIGSPALASTSIA